MSGRKSGSGECSSDKSLYVVNALIPSPWTTLTVTVQALSEDYSLHHLITNYHRQPPDQPLTCYYWNKFYYVFIVTIIIIICVFAVLEVLAQEASTVAQSSSRSSRPRNCTVCRLPKLQTRKGSALDLELGSGQENLVDCFICHFI